ncbi:MAG: PAS domain S-box protein, partial [Thermodesulfobacteriota bacterium]
MSSITGSSMIQPVRILVADYDQDVLELFKANMTPSSGAAGCGETAEPGNYELTLCHRGDEAVEAVRNALAENRPYPVVFLEAVMPQGPAGIEVAESIRRLDPSAQIVLMTAHPDFDPADPGRRFQPAHHVLFLEKPVQPREIRYLAGVWAARRRGEDPPWEMDRENSLSLIKATLEATADGLLVVDRHGLIERCNQKFVQMFDLSEEVLAAGDAYAVLDRILDQVTDPESFKAEVTAVIECPEAERRGLIEFKDGRVYELFSQPRRVGGRGVGRVWSFRDVTARKRAEEALRENEEKYRLVVENANDGILVAQDGRIKFVNRKILELGRTRREEVLGKPFMAWIHPEYREMVLENHRKRLQGEPAPESYDIKTMSPQGQEGWMTLRAVRIMWEGRPATLNVLTDITDRKRAEEAVRRSETRYRDLFDNISDFIYTHDLAGRFTTLNRTAAESLGYHLDEMLSRQVPEFIPEKYRAEFESVYIEGIMETGAHTGIMSFLAKDGGCRYLEYRNTLVREEGEVPYVRGSARDITERVLAEREM